jgi:peptide subunit release factor 1 (eRF1)
MANAKIISFVDHQITATVEAVRDDLMIAIEDRDLDLRTDVRKALEAALAPLQQAISTLRKDVDLLQKGGGSPTG